MHRNCFQQPLEEPVMPRMALNIFNPFSNDMKCSKILIKFTINEIQTAVCMCVSSLDN